MYHLTRQEILAELMLPLDVLDNRDLEEEED